jgi:hypothetical protein
MFKQKNREISGNPLHRFVEALPYRFKGNVISLKEGFSVADVPFF